MTTVKRSRALVLSAAEMRELVEKSGPDSPLRQIAVPGGRRRATPEEDAQIAAFATLVGPARKGQPRDPAGGMIPKYPALRLLHAIPNGGHRSPKTAARMKAQGVLANLPDIHLPVMRGPFAGLYVEAKDTGRYGRPAQRAMAALLRAEGHCVLEAQGAEEIVAAIVGYLELGANRPSARAVCGPYTAPGTLEERIQLWRDRAHALLTPNRRKAPLTP